MKTIYILKGRVVQITLAGDLVRHAYPGATTDSTADSTVVAVGDPWPAPTTDLGVLTYEALALRNAEIAAGVNVPQEPARCTVDGRTYWLRGNIFVPEPSVAAEGAVGVVTQALRIGNFVLSSRDSGTIIPVKGVATVTLSATSALTAPVEIRRYDAASLSITSTGVVTINPATGAAWGALAVLNKLASIIIFPGNVSGEYAAVKVGA